MAKNSACAALIGGLVLSSPVTAATCLSGEEVAHEVLANRMKVAATIVHGRPALVYAGAASGRCLLGKRKDGDDAFTDEEMPGASPDPAPERSSSLTGKWIDGSRQISIEEDGPDKLRIEGYASFSNAREAISTGEFHGFVATNDIETSKVGFREDRQERPSSRCYLQLRLVGSFLLVLDSGSILGSCGGQNVSFSGVYVKAE